MPPKMHPPLHVQLARIGCLHGRLKDRPCGRCSGQAVRAVNQLGEELITAAARILMRAEGFNCPPTALVYERTVNILKDLVPLVLAEADRQDASPLPPGCTGYLREDLDYGEQIIHNQLCPVHTYGCPLACAEGHTYEPGCQLHLPPP